MLSFLPLVITEINYSAAKLGSFSGKT